MLTRVFEFTADATGRTDYRIAYEAFRARDPQKCTKEERRYLAELQRAFEAIGEPVGELPPESDLDLRFRTLQAEGGSVRLSQPAFERVDAAVSECSFQAGLSRQVVDFLDRWSTAEKLEDAAPPERRPRAIGK